MNLESVLKAIENVEQSIASLKKLLTRDQAEQDAFTAFLYEARRNYGVILDHEGEMGSRLERFLNTSHQDALRFGFNGSVGAWEHLLGLAPCEPGDGETTMELVELSSDPKFLIPWDIRQAA